MIKNYTSTVPVGRTVMRIEAVLVEAGATGLGKEYSGGKLVAISFQIAAPGSGDLIIKLPANVEAIRKILEKEITRPQPGTMDRVAAQAERTAWKLIQDWVEVQMAMVKMKQVELAQVFLSYIIWNGKPLYEQLKGSNFKLIRGPESK